jgi:hypothetical protein
MSTPTQPLCTIRDLEDVGFAAEALAVLPDRQKRNAIRVASGIVAAPLRKRHLLPLTPYTIDLDASGLTMGATASLSGTSTQVADVAAKILTGGSVGAPGVTYKLSVDAGVTYGASQVLPLSGEVVIDGVTLALSGDVAVDDVVSYGAEVDAGIKGAAVEIAVDILTGSRGRDAETAAEMARRYDRVLARVAQIAEGMAELAADADATPVKDEGSWYGDGDRHPWDFLDAP